MTTSEPVARLVQLGRDREAAELGAASSKIDLLEGAPMQPLDQLDQLGPLLAGVVGNISREQLDNPTPCAKFTVGDVLGHMVGGATAFAAAFRGRPASGVEPAADCLTAFGPVLGELAAAMHEPGAMERTIVAPFGEFPGTTFARFVILDGLVHGWDLATATGQVYAPPDKLVAEVASFARGVLDGMRDGETFGPATRPPADATPIEQLAAFTGRQVRPGR